jgi:hypothetical protein
MTVSGKIPQYRFVYFPSTDGGTWWRSVDSNKVRRFNESPAGSVRPSPVPTGELLSILCLYRCRP